MELASFIFLEFFQCSQGVGSALFHAFGALVGRLFELGRNCYLFLCPVVPFFLVELLFGQHGRSIGIAIKLLFIGAFSICRGSGAEVQSGLPLFHGVLISLPGPRSILKASFLII